MLSKAPDSESAKLYTIPAAAVQQHKKVNSFSTATRASGFLGPESRASAVEHLESELAAFKCKPGYIMKKNGAAEKVVAVKKPKKEKGEADNKGIDEKKTAENLLKRPQLLIILKVICRCYFAQD